jgi:ATP-binding cassette subfamily F protein 3
MLGAFLFRGDDVFKSVSVLSGGEKSRLALLSLLLRPVNLLILDEPTNHLDLHSKDVLLRALESFSGTVIFVSHDRGFIESLATRVLELRAGRHARVFPGDYTYYLERLASEETNAGAKTGAENIGTPTSAAQRTINVQAQKQEKTERRKLMREEERLMAEITAREKEKAALEAELAMPNVYSDYAKSAEVQQKIDSLAKTIEELTAAWEAASS